LPPEAPSALTALLESNSVSLSWTANDENVTSYSIRSKDSAEAAFTELNTSSTASFTDVLEAGASRWYRVFAINADGTSIGSNVIRVDNPES
jgi:fibronectin type 3 domain-containing protein